MSTVAIIPQHSQHPLPPPDLDLNLPTDSTLFNPATPTATALDSQEEPSLSHDGLSSSSSVSSSSSSKRRSRKKSPKAAKVAQQTDKPRAPDGQRLMTSGFFPLSYKQAAVQWWTNLSPPASERAVLKLIPYLKEAISPTASPDAVASRFDPFGRRIWRSNMVGLSGKNRALNEYSVERVGEPAEETLVMLHGYGAGLGLFYKNFEPITRVEGWKLYALDMLGMGNSSRPPFRIKAKDPKERTVEAENFFVDALEEWRKVRNIEKFTLLGHSMGGYLAVCYALKYPGRLNKLILASPVGVPENPYATSAELPEPSSSTLANEFTQSQEDIVQQNSDIGTKEVRVPSPTGPSSTITKQAPAAPSRNIPGWFAWLWEANLVSPFTFVRVSGPLGPRFASGWTSRRFNHLPPEEAAALHMYAYNLFRQKGSGEFSLPYILAPGAYARNPLINRIDQVGRQVGPDGKQETGFPLVFMYGDSDWMDVTGGFASEEIIKKRVEKALMEGSAEERRDENGSAKVIVVRKAGHHLYLDNPDEFNEYIRKELEETRDYNRRRRAQGLPV